MLQNPDQRRRMLRAESSKLKAERERQGPGVRGQGKGVGVRGRGSGVGVFKMQLYSLLTINSHNPQSKTLNLQPTTNHIRILSCNIGFCPIQKDRKVKKTDSFK